ncbi:MAG: hypothetical protein HY781_03170 [Chloroflexi bacterium]|nr:hypothetical protein [Chloroflexota bacterium]
MMCFIVAWEKPQRKFFYRTLLLTFTNRTRMTLIQMISADKTPIQMISADKTPKKSALIRPIHVDPRATFSDVR